MRTIPNKIRKSWPRGTYRACCDMCGAAYMRHQLITKESGLLACTGANGCAKGRDAGQLSSGDPSGHGRADSNTLPVIHRTTAADILRYNDEDVT